MIMKNRILRIIITVLSFVAIVLFIADIAEEYIDKEKIKTYFSIFVYPDEFDADNKPYSTHNFDNLTDIEKKAYISIFNSIEEHPEYIKIPYLTSDEYSRVYFAVKNDNPNMLCFSEVCTVSAVYGKSALLSVAYECSADECNKAQSELIKTVKEIIAEMPEYNTDYDKELYIHDYIAKNCVYDEGLDASTAYNCLIDGYAICSGYARAAMLLLREAGIDSMLIGGNGYSESQGYVSHMWNIVWLDGEAYHLDVTWDDHNDSDAGYISHMYFNVTDEMISQDHSDFELSYECTALTYNYFYYNNILFDTYDTNVLNDIKLKFLNNIQNGQYYIEFAFDNDTAYSTATQNLLENLESGADIYNVLNFLSKYVTGNISVAGVNVSCDDNRRSITMMLKQNV